ncbi:DNA-binding transcriptional MerR regulator [Nocardia kruczakiae]|uniref:DNA-binding transcriptional MerR regulator n=1 Tax=Nocardia kruczakiae TaxID=261477 RepID=A0ABU1XKG7_9NOCA|nr:MerR family transcriptional regulator [Nocardia kruczakiae]MDR7170979.1 DNA-binding transcriptional MerR regulator [Nocardia kruczakiae]
MPATVSIGEFSRLTYLSVKTLRYYHEIELLEPASVDPGSGYRRYSTAQVEQAHLIRRLRDLDMPMPQIRAVLAAPDRSTRDAALAAHLERMEAELLRTRDVVASLRALLSPGAPIDVQYRLVPEFTAVTIRALVSRAEIGAWCGAVFPRLYDVLAVAGVAPGGPSGATYSADFFENEIGEVVAFAPLAADPGAIFDQHRDVAVRRFPQRRFAIAVHAGPFTDFDRTYGALGSHVAEHDTALAEPIREIYVVGPQDCADPAAQRTEVCWPIAPA